MLNTNSFKGNIPTAVRSGGFAEGAKIGATGTYTYTSKGYGIVGGSLNLGLGLPSGLLPINGAAGVSNTWVLHDFFKK